MLSQILPTTPSQPAERLFEPQVVHFILFSYDDFFMVATRFYVLRLFRDGCVHVSRPFSSVQFLKGVPSVNVRSYISSTDLSVKQFI